MPISEKRVKDRLTIREGQVSDREIFMLKLRKKIAEGYIPKDKKEFADVLRMVQEYGKHVGFMEECQEILAKLSEEKPMAMEKLGVECNGEHGPTKDYMEKVGGEMSCRYCGQKFAVVAVEDKANMSAKVGSPKPDKKQIKGSIEKMFGV